MKLKLLYFSVHNKIDNNNNNYRRMGGMKYFTLLIVLLQYAACHRKKMGVEIEPIGKVNVSITHDELIQSIEEAEKIVEKLRRHEQTIQSFGLKLQSESAIYGQQLERQPGEEALEHTKTAFLAVKATQQLAIKYCPRKPSKYKECISQLSKVSIRNTTLGEKCDDLYKNIRCSNESKIYRSIDGSCNNVNDPTLGKSNTAYRRLLQPNYEDGLYTLRGSKNGNLPNPRVISTTVKINHAKIEHLKTLSVPIWGIFIAHDLSNTPCSNMVNIGATITCCTNDGRAVTPRLSHLSCAPITIPKDDIFYAEFFQTCMDYVRSLPAVKPTCTLGPLEQINQATHFLDGSMIYGTTEEKAGSLRKKKEGRLKTMTGPDNMEYLPTTHDTDSCKRNLTHSKCYETGDSRMNDQPQLITMHTLFVREHNRIAERLSIINSHWDDQRLYDEARRIVIAEIQHITYTSWLPLIIGEKYGNKAGVLSRKLYGSYYDRTVAPTISNAFATAGIPFLHSMIDGNIGMYTEERILEMATLLQYFYKTSHLKEDAIFMDSLIRGLATQSALSVDTSYTDAVTAYWYSTSGDYGMDLLSLYIQRGRDHGLPSYNQYRKFCGLTEAKTFDDLRGTMTSQVTRKLEKVYKNVEDIDLIIGSISETASKEALVGPTLQCILTEQFLKTRIADRFFYDDAQTSFTKSQLDEIKKANLARIFCDNSNNVTHMQINVFQKSDHKKNKLTSCDNKEISAIDLEAWKEEYVL